MTNTWLITNVRPPTSVPDAPRLRRRVDRRRPHRGDRPASLPREPGAALEDGGGALLLPGFVEGHTHLDKTHWGMAGIATRSARS